MDKLHQRRFRAAVCRLHPDEEVVQSGLAYTPSDMMKLAADGIPISQQNAAAAVYDEGYRELDFEPRPELQRYADMADLWEKEQDIRKTIHGNLKKDMKKGAQDGE